MESKDTYLFGLLPIELFQMVVDHLNGEDRSVARSVSKEWLNQINTNHIIVNILLPHQIPDITQDLQRYSQLSLTVNKSDKLTDKQLHDLIQRLPNMTSLELKWLYKRSSSSLDISPFKQLEKLIVPNVSFNQAMPHLTYLDANIKLATGKTSKSKVLLPKLEVCIGPMDALSLINSDTLTSLTINNIDGEIRKVSFNEFSRLKKLDIRAIDSHYSVYDGPFGGSEPRDPLDLDLPYLEEFHVKMDFKLNSTRLTRLTVPDSMFRSTKFDHYRFTLLNLKSLTLTGMSPTAHVPSFPPRLQELVWENYGHTSINVALLPTSLTKLKTLLTQELLGHLDQLPNLEDLDLDAATDPRVGPMLCVPSLKKLTIKRAKDIYLNFAMLPSLTSLNLRFSSKLGGTMDLAALTGLRVLILPMTSTKTIIGLESLTNLEHLDVPYVSDNALQSLSKLTRLLCCQYDTCHNLSNLTRLRELDFCFTNDEEIIALSNLRHLTYLVCRTRTCNTVHLTLLTRLQTLAVTSNISERSDWHVDPWTRNNARYEISSKLPHLILLPNKW